MSNTYSILVIKIERDDKLEYIAVSGRLKGPIHPKLSCAV